MSGIVFDFVAEPSSVSVDDLGMTLGLATYMTTRTWTHFESGLGSLAGYYSEPAYTSDPPSMAVSLSLDFFNQVFYAAWGAGLLDQSLTADALGISMESFGTFLGMTDLSITTSALLPPVVIPGTDDALMELQVGDLELTLYDGPVDPANVTLQVYVSLLAGFDVTVTDSLLSPSLGDVTVYFDVTVPAANTSYAADTEDLLDALIPLLLPAITGTLGEIPLPALDGFSLTLSDLRGDGAENGYLTLDGVLAIE
jgi:hypothetical protein